MIDLYTFDTPNGRKIGVALEEMELPYRVHVVDITKGEQHAPAFLKVSPNNKIPAIVDPDGPGGAPVAVFESGAILLYLADRSGVLKPANDIEAGLTLQWMLFQAGHVGPTLGQLWNYKIFAAERLPQVIARFERETARILRVLDGQLEPRPYLVGDLFGVADVMTWPWINAAVSKLDVDLGQYPNVARWFAEIAARPAVQRGLRVPAHDDQETLP